MKIILEQAFHSLTRRKLLSALIIVMMVVGLFLIIGAMGYAEHNEERVDDFYSVYPEDEYRFYVGAPSVFGEESAENVTEEKIQVLRKYFYDINNTGDFDFLHFTGNENQYMGLFYPKVDDSCLSGYQDFNAARDIIYFNDVGKYVTFVKAYSIDRRVFDRFKLKIAVGTDFSDFEHTDYDAKVIPIVCGWKWHEANEVGDILTGLSYMSPDLTVNYRIVGFLEPGISILPPDAKDLDTIVSLDTYVLVPYLDYTAMLTPTNADKKDPNFKNLTYYQKYGKSLYLSQLYTQCRGIVFTNLVPNPIEKYAKQAGSNYSSSRRVMMISDSFKQSTDDYFELLLLASVLILASSTLCLSLNLANKLMASFKTYAIHLISGGTVAHIKWFMVFEVLVIMFIANVAAFFCALFFGGGVFTYNEMGIFGVQVSRISPFAAACAIGVSLVVSLIALAFPLIKISVVEYDTLLRGKE